MMMRAGAIVKVRRRRKLVLMVVVIAIAAAHPVLPSRTRSAQRVAHGLAAVFGSLGRVFLRDGGEGPGRAAPC